MTKLVSMRASERVTTTQLGTDLCTTRKMVELCSSSYRRNNFVKRATPNSLPREKKLIEKPRARHSLNKNDATSWKRAGWLRGTCSK